MTKELEKKIERLLKGNGPQRCFTCELVNINWLPELQDIIEGEGVLVETFCSIPTEHIGRPFEVKNGRLRLTHGDCINARVIMKLFAKIKGE